MTLNGGIVENNSAAAIGGGIYIMEESTLIMSGETAVRNNKSENNAGGGVFVTNSIMTMNGGIIENNIARQAGGGVYATEGGVINVNGDAVIRNNTAERMGGGGICVVGSTLNMSENAMILENKVNNLEDRASGGGGIYVQRGYFSMGGNAVIRGNQARNGAGLFGNETSGNEATGKYIITGGSIDTNTAVNNGGGVCILGGELIIGGTAVIADNSAQTGGGINCTNGTLTIGGNAVLCGNIAEQSGGAVIIISIENSGEFVLYENALIRDNTAANGSALFSVENRLILNGGTITGNRAIESGTVYLAGESSEFISGLISENTARYGAGVYLGENTQLVMRDSMQISGNHADMGGGVYINHQESNFVLNGGTISGNTARSGGGVYSRFADTFVQNGGSFLNNTPDDIFPPLILNTDDIAVETIRYQKPADNDGALQFWTNDSRYHNQFQNYYLDNPGDDPNIYQGNVKKISGNNSYGFGILFCVDNSVPGTPSYYRLFITVNGRFTVQKMADGRWTAAPLSWRNASALKRGYDVYNHIKVEKTEANDNGTVTFNIYFNDTLSATFNDDAPLNGVRAGLVTSVNTAENEMFPLVPVDVRFGF